MNTSRFKIYILLFISFFVMSCGSTVVERERKAISRGVYATKDAMDVSRFDLAKSYNNELTRIVPPPAPKDRIKIAPFQSDATPASKTSPAKPSQRYVVLPDSEKNENIIVANSPEYQELLSENTQLRLSEKRTLSDYEDYRLKTDKVLRDKDAELQKARQEKGFFAKAWGFITGLFKWGGLGFLILAIGLLLLSIFFRPAIDIFFMFLKIPVVIVMTIVRMIRGAFGALGK